MNPWITKAVVLVSSVTMIVIRAPHGHRSRGLNVVKNRKGRLETGLDTQSVVKRQAWEPNLQHEESLMQRVLESLCKRFALAMVVFSALAAEGWAQCAPAQTISGIPPVSNWQIAAGGKMSFDVASVKPSKPGSDTTSNFPLGPGEIYAAVGGRFCATGTTALNYLAFAYKLAGRDRQSIGASLPGWVSTDGFDIEAKGAVNATKDQMRLMMQSVLADRFKVAIHQETRQAPALRMLVVQPGKLGPQLQIHADEGACVSTASNAGLATPPSPPSLRSGLQLPTISCGGITQLPASAPGRLRIGARNISLAILAAAFANPQMGIDRPVIDGTGLTGKFDFSLEFSPERDVSRPDLVPDGTGPTFLQALQEQLGLKLQSTITAVSITIVDHIERPTEN